jgi:hypothetical protein
MGAQRGDGAKRRPWTPVVKEIRLGDLLAVERIEAAMVFAAWAQGLPCEHRADCSALAILGCALITAPRATNGHTSVEHAIDFLHPGD